MALTVGLAATTQAAAPSPSVISVSSSITDPAGDQSPTKLASGDLRSVRVATANSSGVPSLYVYATVSTWVSLTSTNWATNDTYLDWYLDTNADGVKDFDLYLANDLNVPHVDVSRVSTGAFVCSGVPMMKSGTGAYYGARVPLSCLGNPRTVRASASIRFSDGAHAATDNAPNAGFTAVMGTNLWPNRTGTPVVSRASRALNVSWSAPALSLWPVTDYVVQYKLATATNWSTFADGVSTARTARITGLTSGRKYVVRVIARNKLGAGVVSTTSAAVAPN